MCKDKRFSKSEVKETEDEQIKIENVGEPEGRNRVYDIVSKNGWGDVSSRDCGNMVTKAIEIAEKSVNSQLR